MADTKPGGIFAILCMATVLLQFLVPETDEPLFVTWTLPYKVAFSLLVTTWLLGPRVGLPPSARRWIPLGVIVLCAASIAQSAIMSHWGQSAAETPRAPGGTCADDSTGTESSTGDHQTKGGQPGGVQLQVLTAQGRAVADAWVSAYAGRSLVDAARSDEEGFALLGKVGRDSLDGLRIFALPPGGGACSYGGRELSSQLGSARLFLGTVEIRGHVSGWDADSMIDMVGVVPDTVGTRELVVPLGFEFGRSQTVLGVSGGFGFTGLRPGAYRLFVRRRDTHAWVAVASVQSGTDDFEIGIAHVLDRILPKLVLDIVDGDGRPLGVARVLLRIRPPTRSIGQGESVVALLRGDQAGEFALRGGLPLGIPSGWHAYLEIPSRPVRIDLGDMESLLKRRRHRVRL
jgi:hypothetical protein